MWHASHSPSTKSTSMCRFSSEFEQRGWYGVCGVSYLFLFMCDVVMSECVSPGIFRFAILLAASYHDINLRLIGLM